MADCIKCGNTLWKDNEKETGYCDNCRTFSDQTCKKCGKKLWDANEKDTGYCNSCRTFGDQKCASCEKQLWTDTKSCLIKKKKALYIGPLVPVVIISLMFNV